MKDYTGKTIYLGIDVHKKTYSVTAVCEKQRVKRRKTTRAIRCMSCGATTRRLPRMNGHCCWSRSLPRAGPTRPTPCMHWAFAAPASPWHFPLFRSKSNNSPKRQPLLPESLLVTLALVSTLVRVLAPWITGRLSMYAAVPTRKFMPQRTRVFLDFLVEETRLQTAKALQAFPRIRWIAGGMGKEGGIAALQPFLGSVAKAYLIGHSARDFALQLGDTPHEICETMARAVARASAEAEDGDVVLLAPAAASFDQYPNFEKRGEDFTARVKALIG